MHCKAVHCLPDVVCNGLVEQNRLLADDGQSTPGMDEDDSNDEDDVDDGKNDEKGKKREGFPFSTTWISMDIKWAIT